MSGRRRRGGGMGGGGGGEVGEWPPVWPPEVFVLPREREIERDHLASTRRVKVIIKG